MMSGQAQRHDATSHTDLEPEQCRLSKLHGEVTVRDGSLYGGHDSPPACSCC